MIPSRFVLQSRDGAAPTCNVLRSVLALCIVTILLASSCSLWLAPASLGEKYANGYSDVAEKTASLADSRDEAPNPPGSPDTSEEGAAAMTRYGMGLLLEDPTRSAILVESPLQRQLNSPLSSNGLPYPGDPPARVFNTEGLPPVDNQGSQGSCTAWATGYYSLTHQIAKANSYWDVTHSTRQFSPAFIYNHINSGEDSGSYFSDALDLLTEIGCTTMAEMSYNEIDCSSWPSTIAYVDAAKYRISHSYFLYIGDDAGIAALKSYLAEGNTAVMGILVRTEFYNFDQTNNIYTTAHAAGTYYGGHAVCIVGYDDTLSTTDGPGAFMLVNSWGGDWGNGGFWWMSYAAVKNSALSQGYAYYFDVIDQPYVPELLASLRISHERRGQVIRDGIEIGLGSTSWPDWSERYLDFFYMESSDGLYQNHPFPGSALVFDITGALPYLDWYEPNQFYVRCDDSVWPLSGVLERFSVSHGGWEIESISDDTPLVIPDKASPVIVTLNLQQPHISIDPLDYAAGHVIVNGTAVGYSAVTLYDVGFEQGSTGGVWTSFDNNPDSGYSRWLIDLYHSESGTQSLWCAGSPSVSAFYVEHFSMPVWYWPSGWALYSGGTNSNPWKPGGSYGAYSIYCDTGGQADVVEWAIQGPIDASSMTELFMRFYMDYDVVNALPNQKAHVLYSTDGSLFYFAKTWSPIEGETITFGGEQIVRLPDQAISSTLYFAFIFEGDYTGSWTIDDIELLDVSSEYQNDMDTYVSRPADLSRFDTAELTFDYWAEVEAGFDWFSPAYHTPSGWVVPYNIGTTTGWQRMTITVPISADYVGFYFHSDVSIVMQGVYVDNVMLVGITGLSAVSVSIDFVSPMTASGTSSWSCAWDTTEETDGSHWIEATTTFGETEMSCTEQTIVDNTAPALESLTETYQTGVNVSISLHANSLGGSPLWQISFVNSTYDGWFADFSVIPLNMTAYLLQFGNTTYIPDGIYDIEMTLIDWVSLSSTITVHFAVDNAPPKIAGPSSIAYIEGTTGNSMTWTCTDLLPATYDLYLNGRVVFTGPWSTGVMYGIDGLLMGTHNLTVVFRDLVGHKSTHSVTVTVTDNTVPTVSHPADVDFSEGTTGHFLTWVAADLHPHDFEVLLNGTPYVSAMWDSDIILLLDALRFGTYNLTLVVRDSSGNTAADTVFVEVLDTTPPTLTELENMQYLAGTTGHVLIWTTEDWNPGSYEVFRDGDLVSTGTLVAHCQGISISVDGLQAGTYALSVVVIDMGGNSVSDTVTVTVIPVSTTTTTTPPTTSTASTTTTPPPTSGVPLDALPLLFVAGGIAAAVVVVVFLYLRKRNR